MAYALRLLWLQAHQRIREFQRRIWCKERGHRYLNIDEISASRMNMFFAIMAHVTTLRHLGGIVCRALADIIGDHGDWKALSRPHMNYRPSAIQPICMKITIRLVPDTWRRHRRRKALAQQSGSGPKPYRVQEIKVALPIDT